MTAERARELSGKMTSSWREDPELCVSRTRDEDYDYDVTTEIANGLLELAQMKEAVAKEKKELEEKPWCVSYWHTLGSLEEIEDAGTVIDRPN